MSTTFYIDGQPERADHLEVNLSNMNAAALLHKLTVDHDYSGSIEADELIDLVAGADRSDDEWHREGYWNDVMWRLHALASAAYILDRKVVWA